MGAQLRSEDSLGLVNGGPVGVPFDCTSRFLATSEILELLTRSGELDLVFRPAGTQGFADLDEHAVSVRLGGVSVRVSSLDDVIRSKEAADRPKDRRALPLLRQLAEELRNGRHVNSRQLSGRSLPFPRFDSISSLFGFPGYS